MKSHLPAITAGFIAVLVGFTSSAAIVLQAAKAAGATPDQTGSWMMALGIGMGITTIGLSLRYKTPIITAWSTPGAALLATSAWLWNNATVAAVYAPGLCVVLGVFLLLLRARARRQVLPVLLAGGLAGLGLGLHYGVATCGLGFGLLVLLHLPPEPRIGPGQAHAARKLPHASLRFGLRMAGGAALWACAGATVNYALLTFRAARDPAVNALNTAPLGDPVLWLALGGSYGDWWGRESTVGLFSCNPNIQFSFYLIIL